MAFGTVIRGYVNFIAHGFGLVLHHQHILYSCTQNSRHAVSCLFHGFNLQEQRRNHHATAHAEDFAELFNLRRIAQRTSQILHAIALVQKPKLLRSLANLMKSKRHRALLRIVTANSQRNALTLLADNEHNELSRLSFRSDVWSLDLEQFFFRSKLFY